MSGSGRLHLGSGGRHRFTSQDALFAGARGSMTVRGTCEHRAGAGMILRSEDTVGFGVCDRPGDFASGC